MLSFLGVKRAQDQKLSRLYSPLTKSSRDKLIFLASSSSKSDELESYLLELLGRGMINTKDSLTYVVRLVRSHSDSAQYRSFLEVLNNCLSQHNVSLKSILR